MCSAHILRSESHKILLHCIAQAFVATLGEDLNPQECLKKFEQYKTEFNQTKSRIFFGRHKDEEWCVAAWVFGLCALLTLVRGEEWCVGFSAGFIFPLENNIDFISGLINCTSHSVDIPAERASGGMGVAQR